MSPSGSKSNRSSKSIKSLKSLDTMIIRDPSDQEKEELKAIAEKSVIEADS
jgi:hypothetical protein